MKEKIKGLLVPIGLFYMLAIIFLSINSYCHAEKEIELSLIDNFKGDINRYKIEANDIKDMNCRNSLNNLITSVEKSNYNGKVSIKDYFNRMFIENETITSNYSKLRDVCPSSYNEESVKKYEMSSLLLSTMVADDVIVYNYITQYEFRFEDNLIRNITLPSLVITEDTIKQRNELKVIDSIIKMIKEEEELNEE